MTDKIQNITNIVANQYGLSSNEIDLELLSESINDVYLIKTDSVGFTAFSTGLSPDPSLPLEALSLYFPNPNIFYYDLVGRTIRDPRRLAPGQLYITTVYSSAGRLLGRKLKLVP